MWYFLPASILALKLFKLYEYNRAIDLAETFQTLAASQAQFHEEMANSYRGATSVDLGE